MRRAAVVLLMTLGCGSLVWPEEEWEAPATRALASGDWRQVSAVTAVARQHDAVANWLAGHAALATGDYPAAAGAFGRIGSSAEAVRLRAWAEALIARDGENAAALLLLADALAREGREEEALRMLSRALDPPSALAYNLRGALLARAGRAEESLGDFTAAIGLDGDLADAYANRGLVRLTLGRAAEALEDLTLALEKAPRHAVALHARGIARAQTGDWPGAEQDLKVAEGELAGRGWAQSNLQKVQDRISGAPEETGGGQAAAGMISTSLSQPSLAAVPGTTSGSLRAGPAAQTGWRWGPENWAWQIANRPLRLFDATYAKQWYATQSEQALLNPREPVWMRGTEATAWDLIGGYVPGKPANEGQAKAQLLWSVATWSPASGALKGVGLGRTFGSSLINTAEGNQTGAALDILNLGGYAAGQRGFDGFRDFSQAVSRVNTGLKADRVLAEPYRGSLLDLPLNWYGRNSNWIGRNRSGGELSFRKDSLGQFPLGDTRVGGNRWQDWRARWHDIQYYVDVHASKGQWVQVNGPFGYEYYQSRGNAIRTNLDVMWDYMTGFLPTRGGQAVRNEPLWRVRTTTPAEPFVTLDSLRGHSGLGTSTASTTRTSELRLAQTSFPEISFRKVDALALNLNRNAMAGFFPPCPDGSPPPCFKGGGAGVPSAMSMQRLTSYKPALGFEKPGGVIMPVQVVYGRRGDFSAMFGAAPGPPPAPGDSDAFYIPFLVYCGLEPWK